MNLECGWRQCSNLWWRSKLNVLVSVKFAAWELEKRNGNAFAGKLLESKEWRRGWEAGDRVLRRRERVVWGGMRNSVRRRELAAAGIFLQLDLGGDLVSFRLKFDWSFGVGVIMQT